LEKIIFSGFADIPPKIKIDKLGVFHKFDAFLATYKTLLSAFHFVQGILGYN
tara:strand:- start:160 stop:315 length:156 start_codon:yes stop_codon:yes gene_type:complete